MVNMNCPVSPAELALLRQARAILGGKSWAAALNRMGEFFDGLPDNVIVRDATIPASLNRWALPEGERHFLNPQFDDRAHAQHLIRQARLRPRIRGWSEYALVLASVVVANPAHTAPHLPKDGPTATNPTIHHGWLLGGGKEVGEGSGDLGGQALAAEHPQGRVDDADDAAGGASPGDGPNSRR